MTGVWARKVKREKKKNRRAIRKKQRLRRDGTRMASREERDVRNCASAVTDASPHFPFEDLLQEFISITCLG